MSLITNRRANKKRKGESSAPPAEQPPVTEQIPTTGPVLGLAAEARPIEGSEIQAPILLKHKEHVEGVSKRTPVHEEESSPEQPLSEPLRPRKVIAKRVRKSSGKTRMSSTVVIPSSDVPAISEPVGTPRPELPEETYAEVSEVVSENVRVDPAVEEISLVTTDMLTHDVFQQLSGLTVPTPELPNDPIRGIMDRGVEDALRESGLREETPQLVTEMEMGEIAASPPTEHPTVSISSLADDLLKSPTGLTTNQPLTEPNSPIIISPHATESPILPAADIPRTATRSVRVPTPEVSTPIPTTEPQLETPASRFQLPTRTVAPSSEAVIPSQSKGKLVVPSFGEKISRIGGRSWRSFQAAAALPKVPTLESVSTGLDELRVKHNTSIEKLYKDINSINNRRREMASIQDETLKRSSEHKTSINSLIKAHVELDKKVDDAIIVDRRERAILKGRVDILTTLYEQLTGQPLSSIPQAPQVVGVAGSEVFEADRARYTARDMNDRYNEGYEDALINMAGKGILTKEATQTLDILPPDFKRNNELWHAFEHAKRSRRSERKAPHRPESSSHPEK